jgi:hypothetical protein
LPNDLVHELTKRLEDEQRLRKVAEVAASEAKKSMDEAVATSKQKRIELKHAMRKIQEMKDLASNQPSGPNAIPKYQGPDISDAMDDLAAKLKERDDQLEAVERMLEAATKGYARALIVLASGLEEGELWSHTPWTLGEDEPSAETLVGFGVPPEMFQQVDKDTTEARAE